MRVSKPGPMETEWSEATKRTVAIAGVLIGILVLYISRPVIPFIIMAFILAFLLNPVVCFFNARLRMPRWLAVVLTYLLLLVAMVLFLLIVTPAIVDAVRAIDIDMMGLLDQTTTWLQRSLEGVRYLEVLGYQIDLSRIVDPALETLTGVVPEAMLPSLDQIYSSIPSALDLATGIASTVVGTVLWAVLAFLFTLIYSIYVSLDLPKFGDAFLELIPAPYRAEYAHLGSLIRRVWAAYFRGQLILVLIIGLVVSVGNTALGVPGALVLGILAGLLEVLPNIGPVLAAIPAILLALLQGSSVLSVSNLAFALIVTLFYLVVQQLENSIIVPRLIGHAVELHPILIMAGVVVGASVGGILGAFMAAPLIATGRILFQYAYNKILGRPPFSPEMMLAVPQEEGAFIARAVAYLADKMSLISLQVAGILRLRSPQRDGGDHGVAESPPSICSGIPGGGGAGEEQDAAGDTAVTELSEG
jgi:predicted PurR-regulated permease PerM